MTYAYQSHLPSRAVLNVKDFNGSNGFLSPDYWLGDFIPNRDRSDFGTWSKTLVHLIRAEKSGEVRSIMGSTIWRFCCRHESLADVFETPK